jgi:hypothetical protein
MMNSWVENVSSIAYDLYQDDIQDYVPWSEIKKILQFYQSEARLHIHRYQNEDPGNLSQYETRYLEEMRIHSGIGNDRAVQPPVIRERCEWQIQKLNDLFLNLCVPEIDERYPEGLLSVPHTREDIAQWWALTLEDGCDFVWGRSWTRDQEVISPEPPDESVIERPQVNEPVHPAKRELTKLLYFIEEKRESWGMNEGHYLEITNMMKKIFESV